MCGTFNKPKFHFPVLGIWIVFYCGWCCVVMLGDVDCCLVFFGLRSFGSTVA
jgi:hypothetical protein